MSQDRREASGTALARYFSSERALFAGTSAAQRIGMTAIATAAPSSSTSSMSSAGPRERLADLGIDALADAELLALLLGTGHSEESVVVLAHRLLEEQGGILGLARAGVGELADRTGVGVAKGARIAAAVELGRRIAMANARLLMVRLPDARAVDAWGRPRLGALDHEELWMLALDGKNRLRAARRIASGGLHGMMVSPRDPLRAALREGASAFILIHNHPSGDPAPSGEDVTFTKHVAEAGRAVATPLLDHVIVTRGPFASMLELGVVPGKVDETG